jgi:hypothetical protein
LESDKNVLIPLAVGNRISKLGRQAELARQAMWAILCLGNRQRATGEVNALKVLPQIYRFLQVTRVIIWLP